jgi:hypothetical protein
MEVASTLPQGRVKSPRPAEVSFSDLEFILAVAASGWDMPAEEGVERRREPRHSYRVTACLELIDGAGRADRVTVYTRQASVSGVGFITQRSLTVGQQTMLHVPSAMGQALHLACRVVRCREVIAGWFEAAVAFECENGTLLAAA